MKKSEHNSSDLSTSLSDIETDESDFHPELLGLLDNPGVVRFGCLDYPLAVTEDSDEENETEKEYENVPDWIRVSCDDLTHHIVTSGYGLEDIDRNILSRSLDDIHTVFSALPKKHKGSITSCVCNFHSQITLEQDQYGLI